MPVLRKCCCFKSVRNGSFASAIYTLVLYTMILTAGTFHIHTVYADSLLLIFSITMVCLSALLVITSILLLIGLCGDNTNLILPWLITLSLTTILDVSVSLYLFFTSNIDPFKATLFLVDFIILVFNIYCFLCVVSYLQQSYLLRTQCRYRSDKQLKSILSTSKGELLNRQRNECLQEINLKTKDREHSIVSSLKTNSNHSVAKHYLSVNSKDYRNELSVIAEESSGVITEPHRKISSDASSGGRTDISQLMSSHEEYSYSGIRSPIMEDVNSANEEYDEQNNDEEEEERDDTNDDKLDTKMDCSNV